MSYLSQCGGWAHRPRSSPADGSSLLVLDQLGRSVLLRDYLDALSCWSSAAAFCCCSGQALVPVWTAGWSRWAVLISSCRSTSDLVMIQMMSVKYAFTLSLVSCLHSASDASVFAGQGAEPAGPAATASDCHCGATAAQGSCGVMTWQTDDLAS